MMISYKYSIFPSNITQWMLARAVRGSNNYKSLKDKIAKLHKTVIQLNKLATIDKSLIEGEFGEIDSYLKKEVRRILLEIFDR